MAQPQVESAIERQNLKVGLYAFMGALFMLGMGYAAVPLYDLFCRVTGFGGTTQVASAADAESAAARAMGAPPISIRFDASTARDMPWTFEPEATTATIRIGQRALAFYTAKNNASIPITGVASFNVEPEQAGVYFNKIQCFCFSEQTLQPGEELRMPVLYFVDPDALRDPNMKGVEQITLSYTFHRKLEDGE